MEQLTQNTLAIALASAPWLLLGLVAAGLIHAWLPLKLVGSALGGGGLRPVLWAALIGAPMPLCSCGTLPAAFSLRRAGASRASTTSFLIATPETGVDSVALSWVLLGPLMALTRPLAAITSAVAAGVLVGRVEEECSPVTEPEAAETGPEQVCSPGCCEQAGCQPEPKEDRDPLRRSLEGLRFAFTDLLDDLSLWLALGILVAGVVVTLVPPQTLTEWGSGPLAMLLIMLVSVPMYVCATASTPLAHAMLFAGISPGTVLVFLLAGPASNLAGIALVKRELGLRTLLAYLFGVGGMSMLLGMALDAGLGFFQIDLLDDLSRVGAGESELPVILSVISLLLLTLMAIRPIRRYLVQGRSGKDGSCCG